MRPILELGDGIKVSELASFAGSRLMHKLFIQSPLKVELVILANLVRDERRYLATVAGKTDQSFVADEGLNLALIRNEVCLPSTPSGSSPSVATVIAPS